MRPRLFEVHTQGSVQSPFGALMPINSEEAGRHRLSHEDRGSQTGGVCSSGTGVFGKIPLAQLGGLGVWKPGSVPRDCIPPVQQDRLAPQPHWCWGRAAPSPWKAREAEPEDQAPAQQPPSLSPGDSGIGTGGCAARSQWVGV